MAGWADALLLRVDARNQVLIADDRVVLGTAAALGDKPPPDAVFLGRLADGRHVWAVRGALVAPEDSDATRRRSTRAAPGIASTMSAPNWWRARLALLNWHDSARFSAPSTVRRPRRSGPAGRGVNLLNGHEEFPRVDPAVICLVHDGHDRAVLARQTVWPPRLFSLLAGFVEAGESFESCVVREIAEEIGLTVRDVTLSGQPAVAVPAVADGRLPRPRRPRAGVRLHTTARSPRRPGSPAPRSAPPSKQGDWSSESDVAAAAARVDLDRPGDHRVLGSAGLITSAWP